MGNEGSFLTDIFLFAMLHGLLVRVRYDHVSAFVPIYSKFLCICRMVHAYIARILHLSFNIPVSNRYRCFMRIFQNTLHFFNKNKIKLDIVSGTSTQL